jgi:AraC-like DNA-binding protein
MGFKELLQEKRIALAASLLVDTDGSVGEIIARVGYENESFFRAAFRKRYALNPLEYRKKMRGEPK